MRASTLFLGILLVGALGAAGCGDDESGPNGSDPRPGDGAQGSHDRGGAPGNDGPSGEPLPGPGPSAPPPGGSGAPPATGTPPVVSAPAGSDSLRVRLTNGNEVQPITVVTDNGLGHQGWWRVIESGPPPFIELRTIPFPATCPCDDLSCDRTVQDGPVDTLVLNPGDAAEDTWDGTYYERVVEQGQQCQVARLVDGRELRIQFTYSPGVEGLDGQLPQDTSLRSEPFSFGADDEAALVTP